MRGFRTRYGLLAFLVLTGIAIYVTSYFIYQMPGWHKEFAKSLLGLGTTAVIGGLVKLVFDWIQIERNEEKEKIETTKQLLDQFRSVHESVEEGKLWMEAQKSPLTYSDKIKENIVPAIAQLFTIKRSIRDGSQLDSRVINRLRLSILYMIAYLKGLVEEYKRDYLPISNQYYYQQKINEKAREVYVDEIIKNYPRQAPSPSVFSQNIPEPSTWVWDSIRAFPHMRHYMSAEPGGIHRSMFTDFYDYIKKVLKARKDQIKIEWPSWYDEKLEEKLDQLPISESNDLVVILQQMLARKISSANGNVKKESSQPIKEEELKFLQSLSPKPFTTT
jgi:hypothetical protein